MDTPDPTPAAQRAHAVSLARLTHRGVVTVQNGAYSRSYPNSFVPEGQEVILDLARPTPNQEV